MERFALHRLKDGDGALVFVERWASQAAFDEHTRARAYAALGAGLDGMLAGAPEVLVLESLPEGDSSLVSTPSATCARWRCSTPAGSST